MSKLFVVATPIGNLKDISQRALETLKSVDLILAEDTRVTRKLLSHYEIKTPVESFHANSTEKKEGQILALLEKGQNLALVSDAGTPTISDPGSKLISDIREKMPEVSIETIPGPSALVSALSISGLPSSDFLFLGFLPHKKGRETLFKEIEESKRTVVFYESPHRLMKTLKSLSEHLGSERKVVVAKELTKIYEAIIVGSASAILRFFEDNPDKVRGEFVILISGA